MATPVVILSLILCCGDDAGTDGDAVTRKGCGDTDTGMDVSDDNDNIFDGGNACSGMDIGDDTGTYQGIHGDAGGYSVSSSS